MLSLARNLIALRKIYSTCIFLAIALSASAQSLKLPVQSSIYADTIMLYWGKNIHFRTKASDYAVYFKFETIFGDTVFTTNTTDSLTIIPFNESVANKRAFYITALFHLHGSKEIALSQQMIVKLLSRNDKIEALLELVTTRTSMQNLQLLADAYEAEACYSNAYYVYWKMFSLDAVKAKENFGKYYRRNFKDFNPPYTFER